MAATRRDDAFPNDWPEARMRLSVLEACHDPASRRRATALGAGPGWRCPEAGADGGSFARWLARRVGKEGAVVVADLDTRHLRDLADPHVEVRQVDLTAEDAVERGAYDLVHTRLPLMRPPARDTVLERLRAALRPGGVLLLEEQQAFSVWADDGGPFRAGRVAFRVAPRRAGTARSGSEASRPGSPTPAWTRSRPRSTCRSSARPRCTRSSGG